MWLKHCSLLSINIPVADASFQMVRSTYWEMDQRDCQKHGQQYGYFNSHDDGIMRQVPVVPS